MYEITLEALKTINNERLWFNTNQKLAKLYLDANKLHDVDRLIADLKKSCQLPDGSEDPNKATYLLEVYFLEIQLCTATDNRLRFRDIYPKTLNLKTAVSDPRILGVIREEGKLVSVVNVSMDRPELYTTPFVIRSLLFTWVHRQYKVHTISNISTLTMLHGISPSGGKMYLDDSNWMEAYNEFYEAFRAYQVAGNPRAKDCLKYVVLASILALSDINPFAAREAKVRVSITKTDDAYAG